MVNKIKRVLVSWSSGKDSAWMLYQLRNDPQYEVVGIFSTVNQDVARVAMHGIREELLLAQAKQLRLPVHIISIPAECGNQVYEAVMSKFIDSIRTLDIDCFAFGDLYLADVRRYREQKLLGSGIEAIFPLWGINTADLSHTMIESGLKTVISCIDKRKLDTDYLGKLYDHKLLASLPDYIDVCGENGEFHSFAYAGPMFAEEIPIELSTVVERGDFSFIDIKLLKIT